MIIGVDVGGMSAKAAILTENGLVGASRVATSAQDTFEQTAQNIAQLCRDTAKKAGIAFDEIEAIGMGVPGVIDSTHGVVISWTNFQWLHMPLAKTVSELTEKPVFITNDANAAALGEAHYGMGSRYHDSVLITIGTGVGGGIVLNGKLYEGFRSAGAELGHVVIRQDGEQCTCGRKGCLERYASATALIRMTKKAMQEHPESLMNEIAEEMGEVNGRTVFEGVKRGDNAAQAVLDEYVSALGEGVLNMLNLLRPEAIILGGGISAEGDVLVKPLREYVDVRSHALSTYAPYDILCASLGNQAGIYGAIKFAEQHCTKE